MKTFLNLSVETWHFDFTVGYCKIEAHMVTDTWKVAALQMLFWKR